VRREHVVLDADGLGSFVLAWRALWLRCSAPVFQHPRWALPWVRFASGCIAHALFEGARLVALIVLAEREGGLYFLGHPLNDGNEVMAEDSEAASAVLRAAATAQRAPLVLEHLLPMGPTALLLRRAENLRVAWVNAEPCPILPIGARPGARLTERFELERRRFGAVLRCTRPTAAVVETFVGRRLASWQERGRLEDLGDIERDPAFPGALAGACGALAEDGLCHVASLVLDDRVVAEDLYLGGRRNPLLYMRRYERDSGLSSPGLYLADAVRRKPGVGDIDLGRGFEDYKARLGAVPATRLTADVSPASR